jgi:hypothetical protein
MGVRDPGIGSLCGATGCKIVRGFGLIIRENIQVPRLRNQYVSMLVKGTKAIKWHQKCEPDSGELRNDSEQVLTACTRVTC